ncbi:MAG: GGDEF domain-containing protein [Acidobacteria bacterium]|nr:GGDEF domain-containing protein [Acidobacteriota bacterium]
MEFQPAELDRVKHQIRSLGRRDWLWASIAVLSVLVVAGGVLGLLSLKPAAMDVTLSVPMVVLVGFLYAAAVAVAGFNVYALTRGKEAEKVKTELLLETLENEVGRLQGMIDPMTRVYNRYCLEEMLQKEMSRSERYGKVFALILVDLDKFKEINDRFGHLMGDFVLAEVGEILRSCVRGSDVIIRYGGDEFVLLLSETDLLGAEVVANRMHKKVEQWNATNRVARFDLSVSTGISIYTEGKKATDLIAEADQQMYAMKHRSAAARTDAVH